MEILCNEEGAAVSSGLSKYFGDSEETISEAVANENIAAAIAAARAGAGAAGAAAAGAAAAGATSGHEASACALLSDVLSPPEVGFAVAPPTDARTVSREACPFVPETFLRGASLFEILLTSFVSGGAGKQD